VLQFASRTVTPHQREVQSDFRVASSSLLRCWSSWWPSSKPPVLPGSQNPFPGGARTWKRWPSQQQVCGL